MRTTPTIAIALALASTPAGLRAQETAAPACDAGATAAAYPLAVPVLIVARVHADAVVFESDPDVRITLNGCDPLPGHVTTTSTLPDTIQPGVRYTDVEIRTEYRAWLTIECRAPDGAAALLCDELRRRE